MDITKLAPELYDCFPGIEAEVIGEDEKFVRVEDVTMPYDEGVDVIVKTWEAYKEVRQMA